MFHHAMAQILGAILYDFTTTQLDFCNKRKIRDLSMFVPKREHDERESFLGGQEEDPVCRFCTWIEQEARASERNENTRCAQ